MVTLKDVAKKAGVSIATVSYVLNGTKKLSSEIEKKVKDAAGELNYHPNMAARMLRNGQGSNIALIVPDLSNPWFSELAHYITVQAQSLNLSVTLFTTLYNEETESEILKKVDRHGMIACLIVPTSNKIDESLKTPLLLLDREVKNFPCISFDNYKGGALQARHVLDLKARHALILCDPHISSSAAQRLKGIEDNLKDKISYDIIHQDFSDKLTKKAKDYIESRQADTVICAADIIASAVIRFAAKMNIHIPEDLSLIGFDDIYYAAILQPPLTTIKQDAELLSKQVLSNIAFYIKNKEKKIKFTSVTLPTRLICRKSTKPQG